MCIPAAVIAGAGLVVSAIGTAVQIGNTIAAGDAEAKASEQAAKEASDQARKNEALAKTAAVDALVRGDAAAGEARSEAGVAAGAIRATAAASGVNVDVGTAAELAVKAREAGELDAQRIKLNARREAWGYTSQGEQFRAQGYAAVGEGRRRADAARAASRWGAASAGLSGLAGMFDSVGRNKASGVW